MIYALLLQQNKIYVGYSERPIGERFIEHFNFTGSKWTTMYRPLEVLLVREGGLKEENDLTLEMMKKYGWVNVRGGSWCNVDMSTCPPALLKYKGLKLPTELKYANPPTKHINMASSSNTSCYRCGRTSHFEKDCHAKTYKDGSTIAKFTVPCKRKGVEDPNMVYLSFFPEITLIIGIF